MLITASIWSAFVCVVPSDSIRFWNTIERAKVSVTWWRQLLAFDQGKLLKSHGGICWWYDETSVKLIEVWPCYASRLWMAFRSHYCVYLGLHDRFSSLSLVFLLYNRMFRNGNSDGVAFSKWNGSCSTVSLLAVKIYKIKTAPCTNHSGHTQGLRMLRQKSSVWSYSFWSIKLWCRNWTQ